MKDKQRKPQVKQTSSPKKKEKVNILSTSPSPYFIRIGLIIIALVTFIPYFPSLRNSFTNWDDENYITENPYIHDVSAKTIKSLFAGDGKYYMGNYHPLTMLSLAIDQKISQSSLVRSTGESLRKEKQLTTYRGFEPFWFHLVNLLLHLMVTITIFFVIKLLFNNGWIALAVSLMFGINGMHVESVTWVAERKDVLYAAFFFFSLLSYILYCKKQHWIYLVLSFVLFILSCFSKGQAVSLAVTLFLIDYLMARKLTSIKVILEKIPFLVVAVIFGYMAIEAQQAAAAILEIRQYPFLVRLVIASFGFVNYLLMLLIPVNLSPVHHYPGYSVADFPAAYWLYLIPAFALAGLLIYSFLKKEKNFVFGMGFFVLNIALLLQFFPVGDMIMAERYTYVSSVGFFFLLAAGGWWIVEHKPGYKIILIAGFLFYSLVLCFGTNKQTKVWRNSQTLWEYAAKNDPKSHIAWHNLGQVMNSMNRKQDALAFYTKAVEAYPRYYPSFKNRGIVLRELGRNEEALQDFNKALALMPGYTEANHSRGICYEMLNRMPEAYADFRIALQKSPSDPKYNLSMGRYYYKMNLFDSAVYYNTRAIRFGPQLPDPYLNRAVAYTSMGKYDEAIADLDMAYRIDPLNVNVFINRGSIKERLNDNEGAIKDFTEAIRLKPDLLGAYSNRAIVKQKTGDLEGAIADYTLMTNLKPDDYMPYYQRITLNIKLGHTDRICNDIIKGLSLGHMELKTFKDYYCK